MIEFIGTILGLCVLCLAYGATYRALNKEPLKSRYEEEPAEWEE